MKSFWSALLATLLLSTPARAEEPEEEEDSLQWSENWTRVHPAEYVSGGLLLGGTVVSLLTIDQRVSKWNSSVMWDDDIRNELVLGSRDARDAAVLVGDIFYYGLFAYPNVVDLGLVTLAIHQSTDVAWQMFVINTQAYGLTGLVSTLTQKLAGRSRPFYPECADDPNYDDECSDPENRSQGFISGHAAIAFTGAGLMCAHHAHLPLYGGGAGDTIACSTAILGSLISGVSRIVADRHYASDVIAAAMVGVTSGYLLPELIHYHFGLPTFSSRAYGLKATIVPTASPDQLGLTLTGLL
jgi:membrane-associated phospholipid phosphatase